MKKSWETRKLDEVCQIFNGLWKGKKPPYIEVGVIRNTNFSKDGFLDDSDIAYLPVEIKQFEKRKLEYGDIILEKSGGGPKQPVGRVIPFDKHNGNYSFSNFTSVIRITNKNILDFNFLHKMLFLIYISGKTEPMQRRSTGIRNLQLKEYKQLEIPLPPLQEQKRIVAILDKTFAAIDKAKANAAQNLKNAKELFESYLQSVFENKGDDWEEKTLGEIGKVSMCKRVLKKQTSKMGDVPFYKIGTFGKKPDAYISKDLYNEFRNKFSSPKKGDILISASGTIGRRVIYDGNPAYFQDSNIVWIDNDEQLVLNSFLYHFYKVAKWGTAKGATISRLYNYILENVKIKFPSISKQVQIVKKTNALSIESKKLESVYQKKILELEMLRKSLLQKAFSGEL